MSQVIKNKILLIHVATLPNGRKVAHRYVKRKSKGAGKQVTGKLTLKKYNPILRKHVEYTESKYK